MMWSKIEKVVAERKRQEGWYAGMVWAENSKAMGKMG